MSQMPFELHEEFPNHTQLLHDLKANNAHLAKLFEEYHKITRAVHRAEANVEPTDNMTEIDLRRQRAMLKDQIYRFLTP